MLKEQGGKVETSFSDVKKSTDGGRHRRPVIEDYVYFAEVQRAAHRIQDGKLSVQPGLFRHWTCADTNSSTRGIGHKLQQLACGILPVQSNGEPDQVNNDELQTSGLDEHEVKKINAWRALRQASWSGAFYLCTTDILGHFNAPYAFRQNGYGEHWRLSEFWSQ